MSPLQCPYLASFQVRKSPFTSSILSFYVAIYIYLPIYLSRRYTNQEKYAEAIDLLYDGAMKLSEHGQHQSAADLCMLLVETLKKADDGE